VITAKKLDDQLVEQIRSEPNVREYFTKPILNDVLIDRLHAALSTKPSPTPAPPAAAPNTGKAL